LNNKHRFQTENQPESELVFKHVPWGLWTISGGFVCLLLIQMQFIESTNYPFFIFLIVFFFIYGLWRYGEVRINHKSIVINKPLDKRLFSRKKYNLSLFYRRNTRLPNSGEVLLRVGKNYSTIIKNSMFFLDENLQEIRTKCIPFDVRFEGEKWL